MANEIDETLKRLHTHQGVEGIVVINSEGIPIKSTLDNTLSVQYSGLISSLSEKCRSTIRDLDPSNDLIFVRLRSRKHEIMIAPDREYILMVVQSPVD